MPHSVVFPADNQNEPIGVDTITSADLETLKILKRERDKTLQITNYLEGLYARILVDSQRSTTLSVITDAIRHNSTQTVYQGNADRNALGHNRKP